ncbi:helix-turn-helix transcriptional regulator [Neptunomonas concharum]|uniref:helix-turn-helix transcriptional regulator n=1 Tax=Neptunomonas concharum TaxID=1031538 RepID=UPI001B8650B7|nr:hypothetical protein [Neptunomonas concharum]
MIKSMLYQIKQRRVELCLKQNDMMLRVGVSRQQYQHLESKGNPGQTPWSKKGSLDS